MSKKNSGKNFRKFKVFIYKLKYYEKNYKINGIRFNSYCKTSY
jgi:hypothetical protein